MKDYREEIKEENNFIDVNKKA
jgi:hypothetical protein